MTSHARPGSSAQPLPEADLAQVHCSTEEWPPAGSTSPARTPGGRAPLRTVVVVVCLVVVGAATALGVRAIQVQVDSGEAAAATISVDESPDGPLTEPGADGQLNPYLRSRFDQAAAAAKDEAGIDLVINSGARTVAEQQQMLDDRAKELGSLSEAEKQVAPPDVSEHVKGLAIDVGPTKGAAWLDKNGPRFGLCQIYANEPWHFEPVIGPGGTCPPLKTDAASTWEGN